MYKRFLILNLVYYTVHCWDLTNLGIADDYYVSSIAIHARRAFLTLPRSACFNSKDYPTIVEVPWTVDFFYQRYVRKRNIAGQEWGICKHVQDAVYLDVERRKSRLWILDKGNSPKCEPKVVAFNLFYNSISEIIELNGVSSKFLNTITLDPDETELKAYIGGELNSLIIVSLNNFNWWRVSLSDQVNKMQTVPTRYFSLSRVDSRIFITGRTPELFSISLKDLRNTNSNMEETSIKSAINVTYIGEKLGKSIGLESDIKGGLSYFLINDYAILRWDTRRSLIAENYDVLIQSYDKLPSVSQLFSDPQNTVWALVNPQDDEKCAIANGTMNNIESGIPFLLSRVVKISKYNIMEGRN